MTLEAGKEMDRRCVICWLLEVYRHPDVAFHTHSDEQQREYAHDALVLLNDCHNCKFECLSQKYDELKEKYDALLKEQKAVVQKTDPVQSRECPICRTILKGRFCHNCGQAVWK